MTRCRLSKSTQYFTIIFSFAESGGLQFPRNQNLHGVWFALQDGRGAIPADHPRTERASKANIEGLS